MRAIKKNAENLIKVAESICDVNFPCRFDSDFKIINNCIVLTSKGRVSIGVSIIKLIPCNYLWRVHFYKDINVFKLYIWI